MRITKLQHIIFVLLLCLFTFPVHAESNGLNKKFVKDSNVVMIKNKLDSGCNIFLEATDSSISVIVSDPKTGKNTSSKFWGVCTYDTGSNDTLDFYGKIHPDGFIYFDIYPESKESLFVHLSIDKDNIESIIHSDSVAFCKSMTEALSGKAKHSTNAKESVSYLIEWLKSHGFQKEDL